MPHFVLEDPDPDPVVVVDLLLPDVDPYGSPTQPVGSDESFMLPLWGVVEDAPGVALGLV